MAHFDQVVAEAKEFKAVSAQVPAFRVPDEAVGNFKKAASLHQVGKGAEAFKLGMKAVMHMRGAFGAFIKNSFFERQVPEGQTPRVPHFLFQVQKREEEGYEVEIIAGLRAELEKAQEAFKAETNGVFTGRIAAYKAMQDALRKADEAQSKFDQKRQKGGHAIQKPAPETPMAKRLDILSKRKVEADEARELFN